MCKSLLPVTTATRSAFMSNHVLDGCDVPVTNLMTSRMLPQLSNSPSFTLLILSMTCSNVSYREVNMYRGTPRGAHAR
jgi:hypothetical protein